MFEIIQKIEEINVSKKAIDIRTYFLFINVVSYKSANNFVTHCMLG